MPREFDEKGCHGVMLGGRFDSTPFPQMQNIYAAFLILLALRPGLGSCHWFTSMSAAVDVVRNVIA